MTLLFWLLWALATTVLWMVSVRGLASALLVFALTAPPAVALIVLQRQARHASNKDPPR